MAISMALPPLRGPPLSGKRARAVRALVSLGCVLVGFSGFLTLQAAVFTTFETALGPAAFSWPIHGGDGNNVADGAGRRLMERWEIELIVRGGAIVLGIIISTTTVFLYWRCYVRPTPNLYIPDRAIVPPDLMGRWVYDIWDCKGAWGTCLCFCCCPTCAVAELWYRAGWIHYELNDFAEGMATRWDASCPGWQFFPGVAAHCCLEEATGGCCTALVHTALRGGLRFVDGSNAGLPTPMKDRFGMPGYADIGEFLKECCLYCWCFPCVATQEYRQVQELLKRGPVQQRDPGVVATVVGMPVQVVGAPVVAVAEPKT
jgi:hypothetical protein